MSSSTCRCLPLAVPSRAAGRLTYPTTSTTTRNPRPSPTFSTFLAASRIKTSFLNTVIIISCSLLTCNPPTRSAASTARTSCDANLSRSERSATNFLSEGGKRHPYIADEVKKAIRLGYIGARVITTGTRSLNGSHALALAVLCRCGSGLAANGLDESHQVLVAHLNGEERHQHPSR